MKTKSVPEILMIKLFLLAFLIAPLSSASAGTGPDVRVNMEIIDTGISPYKKKIEAFTNAITQPYEPVHGQPAGYMLQEAVQIVKKFDEISPYFSEWLASRMALEQIVFKFTKTNPDGTREHFYTITLDFARVVNHGSESSKQLKNAYETVAFTYERIQYTHVKSGRTFMVHW